MLKSVGEKIIELPIVGVMTVIWWLYETYRRARHLPISAGFTVNGQRIYKE
jgi:hypothetical protein